MVKLTSHKQNHLTPKRIVQMVVQGLRGTPEEELCSEYDIPIRQYRYFRDRFLAFAEKDFAQELREEPSSSPTHSMPFDLLVESIPHAVFAKDLQGRFLYGNAAYCKIQRTSLEELIGKDDFSIHPPEMAEKYREDDKHVVRTGEVFSAVEENVNIHGTRIWTEVVKAPIYDEHGEISGVIGMFWDVSEKHHAAEALRESEANLRQLLDNAPLPVCVISRQDDILYLNTAFTDFFGYTREEISTLEELWKKTYPGYTKDEAIASYHIMDPANPVSCLEKELLLIDKSGKNHYILVTCSALKDSWVLMMSDVTRLKEIQESLRHSQETLEHTVTKRTQELLEANSRLEHINKLKTFFLSSVSHELRTPLTSILGFAKMITREMRRVGERCANFHSHCSKHVSRVQENAHIIAEEGHRLKRLIDDLLDLSKIESGQMTWDDKDFDLAELARASLKNIRGQFILKPRVELKETIAPGPIPIRADPDRIMQVLMNILNNAAKFTAKGHVSLSLDTVEGHWAEGCIADTGPGISKQDISHIFEQYYQSSPPTDKKKGTGLGLSISKQILNHYKGKFWVESTLGQGTSFYFRLPLAAAAGK